MSEPVGRRRFGYDHGPTETLPLRMSVLRSEEIFQGGWPCLSIRNTVGRHSGFRPNGKRRLATSRFFLFRSDQGYIEYSECNDSAPPDRCQNHGGLCP